MVTLRWTYENDAAESKHGASTYRVIWNGQAFRASVMVDGRFQSIGGDFDHEADAMVECQRHAIHAR